MKVTITWRELFPFPADPDRVLNRTEEREVETEDKNKIETQAILDAPTGCFLYKIEYPDQVVTYNKQGKKRIEYKSTL